MKFASALVKALFLMGGAAQAQFLFEEEETVRRGKIITFDAKKGNMSKKGGLLPSEFRSKVSDYQMKELERMSVDDLQYMINADQFNEEYQGYTMISDDAHIVKKNLDDFNDIQLFSEMYVGSDKQGFNVIFDTGSNWFFVMSQSCETCPTPKYKRFNEKTSDTYRRGGYKSLYYGSGSVHGYVSTDTVCLLEDDDSTCSDNFHFVDVMKQKTLDQLKVPGLVGLSPNHYEANADLFVEKMQQEGAIEDKIFSLSVATGFDQSKVTFGGYDEDAYATGELSWHDVPSYSNYWELTMDKFEFAVDGETKHHTGARRIIIDSGTSFNLMPQGDAEIFMKSIEKTMEVQCKIKIVPFCGCTEEQAENWPDLEYTMDGKKFFIPRDSYLIRQQGTCYMKIMTHPSLPVWIMGLNFFQNYYTVFDMENKQLGFAPSIHKDDRLDDLIEGTI